MSNELQKYNPTQQQAAGWLLLAAAKNKLVDDLTKLQLAAQAVLLNQVASITDREQQLKDYRAAYKAISDARLSSEVVKKIGALLDQLMQYEKAQDPKANEVYKRLETELLQLKKDEADKVARANAHAAEVAMYKAHIQTQCTNMVADFKARAFREISAMYEQARNTNDPSLESATLATIAAMTFSAPVRFTRVLVTDDEARTISAGIAMPDIATVRAVMTDECKRIFVNLESDIAANVKVDISAMAEAVTKEAEQEAFITEIAASVSVPELAAEGKAIKVTLEVDLQETPECMLAIMTEFLKIPGGVNLLRNRTKYSGTTIAQLAAAIGKHCTEKQIMKLPGLTIWKREAL